MRAAGQLVSDGYQTVFCKTCGTFAVNDASTKKYKDCRLCRDTKNFGRCTIPYAYKLLIHLLAAIGINLRPEFMTSEEYADRLFRPRGIAMGGDVGDIHAQLGEADEALDDEIEQYEEGEGTDFSTVYDD